MMQKQRTHEGRFPRMFRGVAALSLLAAPLFTFAQIDPATDDEEEVFELSPFTVDASDDQGYRATATMAGSRIKTQLGDVASSISVITKDFLEDIAANDASTLLTYTTGTEVGGPNGNLLGVTSVGTDFTDTDQLTRSPNLTNRIRGLTGADQTRDFFLSAIPWDSYNIDRVDINRGSNSFLYGLGSAAGIINTNTINPSLDTKSSSVDLTVGRFGTLSAVIDHNQPIIEGKLAARVAIKKGDERFMQEQAFIEDQRLFAAFEYKPSDNTKISIKVEDGEIDSNKPDTRPPLDQISHWIAMGQPMLDHPTNTIINQGTVAPGYLDLSSQRWQFNRFWAVGPLTYFSDNPNTWDASLWGIDGKGAWYAENWQNNGGGTYTGGNQAYMRSIPTAVQYLRDVHAGEVGATKWTTPTMDDPAIFDFFNNLAVGDNKWEHQNWDTFNATIEQRIPVIDTYVQASFDRQDHQSSFLNTWNWQALAFFPDINSHLLDGRPNPNLNRPYMSSAGWATAATDNRETMRLTAYKEFDFNDILSDRFGKLLGKHAITVNYSDYAKDVRQQGGRPHVADPGFHEANPTNRDAGNADARKRIMVGQRALSFFTYVGDAVGPGGSLADANIAPVGFSFIDETSIPIVFRNAPNQAWETYTTEILRGEPTDMSAIHSPWAWSLTREEIKSSSLVLQSTMLDDAIVATLGWREDEYDSFRAPGAIQDEFVYTTTELPDTSELNQKESTFAYGIVARLPQAWRDNAPVDASLFYNTSENFSPTPPRVNILAEDLPPPTGDTEEFGFMVNSKDNSLSLRVTFYETAAAGSSIDNRYANNQIARGLENSIIAIMAGNNDNNPALDGFLSWLKSDQSAYVRNAFNFDIQYGPDGRPTSVTSDEKHGVMFDTRDSVSKGYEAELTFNPMPNWRMALNFSNQEAITDNSSQAGLAFLQMLRPDWSGVPGQIWTFNEGGQTMSEGLITYENEILRQVASDGFPNFEIRENRMNFITNYGFNDGRLKGMSVGAAVRWQDEVVIGQGYRIDPDLGELPDLNNLYYGPAETNYDAWVGYGKKIANDKIDWKVQLNVKNIGVGKELIPVGTQPDGTVAVSRIAAPMTWTLRNSFDF